MAIEKFLSELERIAADRKIKTSVFLLHRLNSARKAHIESSPEDELRVRSLMLNIKLKPNDALRNDIFKKVSAYRTQKKETEQRITAQASQKIRASSVIFLYGNPKKALKAIKLAKCRGLNFSVFTTDSGRSLKGIKAAEEVSRLNIEIRHFPDILAKEALSKSDVVFFEPEAVTKEGKILVPFGTNTILSEAKKRNAPSYCIYNHLDSNSKQVDEGGQNSLFVKEKPEELRIRDVTAIITGQGIMKPSEFERASRLLF